MKTAFYSDNVKDTPSPGYYYLMNVKATEYCENDWHLLKPDSTARYIVQVPDRYHVTFKYGMLIRVLPNLQLRVATLRDRFIFNLIRKR